MRGKNIHHKWCGNIQLGETNLPPVNQGYNTFIPSFTIQKQLRPTQTIKLAYSKRITRPSLQFLNPYVNQTNIKAETEGNPNLSPEVSQTIEFDYTTFIKSSVISASVYYRHTADVIESIAVPCTRLLAIQGTLSTYQNGTLNNSIGGSVFGSFSPVKNHNTSSEPECLYLCRSYGLFVPTDANRDLHPIQWFCIGRAGSVKRLYRPGFAFGSSPRHTIQGTNPSFSI